MTEVYFIIILIGYGFGVWIQLILKKNFLCNKFCTCKIMDWKLVAIILTSDFLKSWLWVFHSIFAFLQVWSLQILSNFLFAPSVANSSMDIAVNLCTLPFQQGGNEWHSLECFIPYSSNIYEETFPVFRTQLTIFSPTSWIPQYHIRRSLFVIPNNPMPTLVMTPLNAIAYLLLSFSVSP
jgi:hypothetical protein